MAWTPGISVAEADGDAALVDPLPCPEQRAISNQLLRRAIDVLQHKSVRDRTIFIACELDGESQTRVAERFGISGGRVSQILKSVRSEVLRALA
jgi:RNA polymerase sigma factor (sigma-70 family)